MGTHSETLLPGSFQSGDSFQSINMMESSSPTQHSWLEMSKTSHGERSSDRFTLSASTAALRAVLMVSTFFHQRGVGKSVYNGPTLRPSSESFTAVGRDRLSPGNQQQLLFLPHFSAGYPVTG